VAQINLSLEDQFHSAISGHQCRDQPLPDQILGFTLDTGTAPLLAVGHHCRYRDIASLVTSQLTRHGAAVLQLLSAGSKSSVPFIRLSYSGARYNHAARQRYVAEARPTIPPERRRSMTARNVTRSEPTHPPDPVMPGRLSMAAIANSCFSQSGYGHPTPPSNRPLRHHSGNTERMNKQSHSVRFGVRFTTWCSGGLGSVRRCALHQSAKVRGGTPGQTCASATGWACIGGLSQARCE
jgi:hypothetical protein